ncbi:hypothetical protein ACWGB8_24065 [Kitasatospora sp. NPDC054939]
MSRLVLVCVDCATHYLPPASMAYPDGPASPLWCRGCQERARAAGRREDPLLARLALAAARQAAGPGAPGAPGAEEPQRPDVRPSRPPVSRRARSAPRGTRSKLL